jgi:hypothetical protein
VIYAPFAPVAYGLVQSNLAAAGRQPVLTLWVAGATIAAPIGLMLGGPLVDAAGVRGGLYVSALLAAVWLHRASQRAHLRSSCLSA